MGTGSTQERLGALQAILNAQQQMVAGGGMNVLVTPQNIYAALAEMTTLSGYKNPDKFFQNPQNAQPQEPEGPSDAEKLAMAQMQIEQMKAQANIQQQQMKNDIDVMKAQLQHIQAMTRLEVENNVNVPGSAV